MKWLSIVYEPQPDPPRVCINCYQQSVVAIVRLIDWQRDDAIVDMSLCEDCVQRAKDDTLGLNHSPREVFRCATERKG